MISLVSGHLSTSGTKRALSTFHLTLRPSVCASPSTLTDYKDILHAIKPVILFFFFFAMLYGKWDLSFPTKDYTHAPALEAWSLNHWTSRRVPPTLFMEPHYGQISSRDLKGNVMKIYIKFFLPAYHNQCCRSNNST